MLIIENLMLIGHRLHLLIIVTVTTHEHHGLCMQDVSCGSSLSVGITSRSLKSKQDTLKITMFLMITMVILVIVTAKPSVGKIVTVLALRIMVIQDALSIGEII